MNDIKRTKAQMRAHMDLLLQLSQHETWMDDYRRRQEYIPADWHKLDEIAPCVPEKTKITIRVDARTVRWFRTMGTGWQARMDAVLRLYMTALVSKEIETRTDRDWKGDWI